MFPCRWAKTLKISEEWVFIFPINFYLFEDFEIRFESSSGTNMADTIHDLGAIAPGLLLPKVITREA